MADKRGKTPESRESFQRLKPGILPKHWAGSASSSGASFFAWHAEASAKRVTADEPQGTMGRVQTAGEAPARSCVVFLAKKSFSWHGPIFRLFKSWKRSILVAYCCKHCKLWVDRWMAQNFKTWGRNNRQAAKESDSAGFLRIEDF